MERPATTEPAVASAKVPAKAPEVMVEAPGHRTRGLGLQETMAVQEIRMTKVR